MNNQYYIKCSKCKEWAYSEEKCRTCFPQNNPVNEAAAAVPRRRSAPPGGIILPLLDLEGTFVPTVRANAVNFAEFNTVPSSGGFIPRSTLSTSTTSGNLTSAMFDEAVEGLQGFPRQIMLTTNPEPASGWVLERFALGGN